MQDFTYDQFRDLVNRDVRSDATPDEAAWLRHPENLPRWWKELRRLVDDVTRQMSLSQAAVDSMPDGPAKDREQKFVTKKREGREYYVGHVERRIAEVEDLAGSAPLATTGQTILTLEYVLDLLEALPALPGEAGESVQAASDRLEELLEAVDPDVDEEAA